MFDYDISNLMSYILPVAQFIGILGGLYGIFIYNKNSTELNKFNAIFNLNKEFNEYFKNYRLNSAKSFDVQRNIEIKNELISFKEIQLEKNKNSNEYIKQKREIKELEKSIEYLIEDLTNIDEERQADVENCMNIMDICYFTVYKLNILDDHLYYNFHKLIKESVEIFEKDSGYDWVKKDYPNVYKLIEKWEEYEKKEKDNTNIFFNKKYHIVEKVFIIISLLLFFLLKLLIFVFFIKLFLKIIILFIF